MTKQRAPLTFERGLDAIAGLIGWAAVAAIAGYDERTVRKWSEPDCGPSPDDKVTLGLALKLDAAYRAAGGDGAPLLHCYATRLETEVAAATADARALTLAVARAAKESGEAIEASAIASLGGSDPRAISRAELEVEQSISALTSVASALRAARGASAPEVAPPAREAAIPTG